MAPRGWAAVYSACQGVTVSQHDVGYSTSWVPAALRFMVIQVAVPAVRLQAPHMLHPTQTRPSHTSLSSQQVSAVRPGMARCDMDITQWRTQQCIMLDDPNTATRSAAQAGPLIAGIHAAQGLSPEKPGAFTGANWLSVVLSCNAPASRSPQPRLPPAAATMGTHTPAHPLVCMLKAHQVLSSRRGSRFKW